jgi:hypothetical protein
MCRAHTIHRPVGEKLKGKESRPGRPDLGRIPEVRFQLPVFPRENEILEWWENEFWAGIRQIDNP